MAHFHLLNSRYLSGFTYGLIAFCASVILIIGAMQLGFSAQLPLMCIAVLFLVVLIYTEWRSSYLEIVFALVFALFITSQHSYVYDDFNLYIGWVNAYPFLLWTAALVAFGKLCRFMPQTYRLPAGTLMYLCLLLVLEATGYYILGIRSVGEYPSLLGLGIIHGPPIIHWFYITAGPVYLWSIERAV